MDDLEKEYWLHRVKEAKRNAKRASGGCKNLALSFHPEDRDGVYESCMDIDAAKGRLPSKMDLKKLSYRLLEEDEESF